MFHLKIWFRSLLAALFIAMLVLLPVLIVSDDFEIEEFYKIAAIMVVAGTLIFSVIGYWGKKKSGH